MSLDIDVASFGARAALSRSTVADLARATLRSEKVRHALVSITFVSRREIAAMNGRHLKHRGPTDVISFGFERASPQDPVIGDIYIAPEVARENARERGESVRAELARLVIHGTLHVLGHDHPENDDREASPMWRRQEALLRRLLKANA